MDDSLTPPPRDRLSDIIEQSLCRAFDAGYTDTTGHLVAALESLTDRESKLAFEDRRSEPNKLEEMKGRLVIATTAVSHGITKVGGDVVE